MPGRRQASVRLPPAQQGFNQLDAQRIHPDLGLKHQFKFAALDGIAVQSAQRTKSKCSFREDQGMAAAADFSQPPPNALNNLTMSVLCASTACASCCCD